MVISYIACVMVGVIVGAVISGMICPYRNVGPVCGSLDEMYDREEHSEGKHFCRYCDIQWEKEIRC